MISPLFLLDRAQGFMPPALPRQMAGNMLLTLMIWKIWSDQFRATSHASQTGSIEPATPELPITFTAACLFEACDTASHAYPGDAICQSLTTLCYAQPNPALFAILRPSRFAASDRHAHLFQKRPVWPKIMDTLGGLPFIPRIETGPLISQAVARLGLARHATPAPVATLMARLLQPWRTPSVYVPACGHGELLLAALAHVTRRYGADHRLQLRAQEADPDAWANTCLQLLARHQSPAQIHCCDVLREPRLLTESGLLMQHDCIMAALPEHPLPPHPVLGVPANFYRLNPALEDGRVGRFWHMLSSLRGSGRMALLIPASLLAAPATGLLRSRLLQENWLDAVITLPKGSIRQIASQPCLLLINKKRKQDTVAFIDPAPVRPIGARGNHLPYDPLAILIAYSRFHTNVPHPDLHPIERETLLAQGTILDRNTLLPGIEAWRQQAMPQTAANTVAHGAPMANQLATA